VADKSFNTSIDSMSDGLSRLSGFDSPSIPLMPALVEELSLKYRKPSITYSGSLLALMEFPPRIRMLAGAPGCHDA
jgi:hypothetical protein